MPDLPDHVRGALAHARLAIANAEARPRKRRTDIPEDDAFTRDEIREARA